MKHVLPFVFLTTFLGSFAACTSPGSDANGQADSGVMAPVNAYILTDSANKMISSYLTSLPVPPDGASPDLHALVVSADLLRDYLSDASIQSVKLMFAHTLEYINAGHEGVPAGYQSGALTLVFGGYDSSGDYVLAPGSTVPNHCIPCPPTCLKSGTAASDLFP